MSSELKAFTELYSDLKVGLQSGVRYITDQAFSKGLISVETKRKVSSRCSNAYEAERTGVLLDSLYDSIKINQNVYYQFADILQNSIGGYVYLAERMRDSVTSERNSIKEVSHKKQHKPHKVEPSQIIAALICLGIGLYVMIWPLDKVAARDKSTVSAIQEYEEHFQQNLPVLNYPFFGRAEDLKKLEEQVVNNSARIVNINGPPAFGKSTLAIKLGELLRAEHQNTIKIIKYVDTETTRPSEYLCSETNGKNGWDQYSSRISEKAIIAHSDNYAVNADDRTSCQWSNQLKQRTVFILDNCEHILQGANKEAFYNFINSHLKRQNTKLTIIIVSQEKLFYTNDGFFALHIAELSTFESRAMLKYYLPKLSNKKADKLSVAVGHCPLALKVAAKLLQERGIDNFRILLKDLNDHSVRTLSSKVTIGEEKFRTIMDVAYMHLDKQTKKCSRLLSLFPGTTNSEMAKHILGSVVDLACIDDVVRKSFIEEIFIGEETRYSMHKLIRDFLREHHPVHKMSRNRHVFDRKFVAYYSNYLKESFKHLFGSKDDFKLNDKEDYILKSLETHNMLYYQNIAFHELKTDNERLEVLSDLAIAAGFLIQEDLVDPRVKLTMFSKTYVLYENKSIFTRLCESSSDQICANIL